MIETYFTLFISVMIMQPQGPTFSVAQLSETFATEAACKQEAEIVSRQLNERVAQVPFLLSCQQEIPGTDV